MPSRFQGRRSVGEAVPSTAMLSSARRRMAMLSEVYSWFTEGFDTEDLQSAWMLLAE